MTSELEAWAIGLAYTVFIIAIWLIGLILIWRIALRLIRLIRKKAGMI